MKEHFLIERPQETERISTDGFVIYASEFGDLKWSAKFPLPQLSQRIYIKMNNIGWATVKGFFASAGFVGVMTLSENPPLWLKKQRAHDRNKPELPQWAKDGIGCEFGAEISIQAPTR